MDEEQGINHGAVLEMMGALADITVGVRRILGYSEGDDDTEDEEGLPDA